MSAPHRPKEHHIAGKPIGSKECGYCVNSGFSLVLGQGHTEAWYQLSKDEQDDLWARVREIDRRAGAVWRIVCDSRWADESLYDWGVIEYPDFDAYRQKVAEL